MKEEQFTLKYDVKVIRIDSSQVVCELSLHDLDCVFHDEYLIYLCCKHLNFSINSDKAEVLRKYSAAANEAGIKVYYVTFTLTKLK